MRISNQTSELLKKLSESAIKQDVDKTDNFVTEILKISNSPQKTLKEIISQIEVGVVDDMGDMGIGDETGLDTGLEGESQPDTESAKQALVEALMALCGSPEECHNAIDQCIGQDEMAGMTDEIPGIADDLGEEMPQPMPQEMPQAMPQEMPMPGY